MLGEGYRWAPFVRYEARHHCAGACAGVVRKKQYSVRTRPLPTEPRHPPLGVQMLRFFYAVTAFVCGQVAVIGQKVRGSVR
eukprot:gene9915-biopygen3253